MHLASLGDDVHDLLGEINIPRPELSHAGGIEIQQTYLNEDFRGVQNLRCVIHPQCRLRYDTTGLNDTMKTVVHQVNLSGFNFPQLAALMSFQRRPVTSTQEISLSRSPSYWRMPVSSKTKPALDLIQGPLTAVHYSTGCWIT
jgi:hypothetical protein